MIKFPRGRTEISPVSGTSLLAHFTPHISILWHCGMCSLSPYAPRAANLCNFGRRAIQAQIWQVSPLVWHFSVNSSAVPLPAAPSRRPPCYCTTPWDVIFTLNCAAARSCRDENTSVVTAFILVLTFKPLLVQNTHFLCSLSFPFQSRGETLL